MEASALFYLAARAHGSGRDVRGGLHPDRQRHARQGRQSVGLDYMSLDELEAATRRMIEIALEAGTSLG